jgi:hypothetical protein
MPPLVSQSHAGQSAASVPAPRTAGAGPLPDAATILARHTQAGQRDLPAIATEIAQLAQIDPALGAQVRAQVEQTLSAVERGQLEAQTRVQARLPDGTAIAFQRGGMEQNAYLDTLRTSADPALQRIFQGLVSAAGGRSDNGSLRGVLDQLYRANLSPAQLVQAQAPGQPSILNRALDAVLPTPGNSNPGVVARLASAMDQLNPVNRLTDLVTPQLANLTREAGLANTEWGARLQSVLEAPGGLAAFRQGMNEGLLNGAGAFITDTATLVGRVAQHANDTSLFGLTGYVGDQVRDLTGGLPDFLDPVIASGRRAEATEQRIGQFGENLGNYISSRAQNPALIRSDVVNGIDGIWQSVQADHARVAAQGPEAEARWFGQIAGRGVFEVGSNFIPVAGQVRRVETGVQVARTVERAVDGVQTAERLTGGARASQRVVEGARPAAQLAEAARPATQATEATRPLAQTGEATRPAAQLTETRTAQRPADTVPAAERAPRPAASGAEAAAAAERTAEGPAFVDRATGSQRREAPGDVNPTEAVAEVAATPVGNRNWTHLSAQSREYLRDIAARTNRAVHSSQYEHLKEALRTTDFERLTPAETRAHRNAFNKVKDDLIAEWERNTGQEWPRYATDVLNDEGKILRRAGQPYDAHHIIENSYRGPHEWWNLHPARFPNEHQAGIHRADGPASRIFP